MVDSNIITTKIPTERIDQVFADQLAFTNMSPMFEVVDFTGYDFNAAFIGEASVKEDVAELTSLEIKDAPIDLMSFTIRKDVGAIRISDEAKRKADQRMINGMLERQLTQISEKLGYVVTKKQATAIKTLPQLSAATIADFKANPFEIIAKEKSKIKAGNKMQTFITGNSLTMALLRGNKEFFYYGMGGTGFNEQISSFGTAFGIIDDPTDTLADNKVYIVSGMGAGIWGNGGTTSEGWRDQSVQADLGSVTQYNGVSGPFKKVSTKNAGVIEITLSVGV